MVAGVVDATTTPVLSVVRLFQGATLRAALAPAVWQLIRTWLWSSLVPPSTHAPLCCILCSTPLLCNLVFGYGFDITITTHNSSPSTRWQRLV
jgi:hypothetical protein